MMMAGGFNDDDDYAFYDELSLSLSLSLSLVCDKSSTTLLTHYAGIFSFQRMMECLSTSSSCSMLGDLYYAS